MQLTCFLGGVLTSLPSAMSLPCRGPAPLSACLSLNDLCRNHGAMDRHEYHSRSRSADQRPTIERPTCRSRSTERPHDSSLMRSMPSLPSGRSAPPSPALTRCDPRPEDAYPAEHRGSTRISLRRSFSEERDEALGGQIRRDVSTRGCRLGLGLKQGRAYDAKSRFYNSPIKTSQGS